MLHPTLSKSGRFFSGQLLDSANILECIIRNS